MLSHDSASTSRATSSSVRTRPRWYQSRAIEPAREALDSCCMIRLLLMRAFSRSSSPASMPWASRTSSPSVTSSVSWARSALVPA